MDMNVLPSGLKGLREFPFSLKAGSVSVPGAITVAAPSLLKVTRPETLSAGMMLEAGVQMARPLGLSVTLHSRCWKDKPQLLAVVIS